MYVHVYIHKCMSVYLYFFSPHILYHSATCLFKLGRSYKSFHVKTQRSVGLAKKLVRYFCHGMEKSKRTFWPTNTIFCNCCGLCNNVNILQCVYLAILLVEQSLVHFDFSLLSIMLQ